MSKYKGMRAVSLFVGVLLCMAIIHPVFAAWNIPNWNVVTENGNVTIVNTTINNTTIGNTTTWNSTNGSVPSFTNISGLSNSMNISELSNLMNILRSRNGT